MKLGKGTLLAILESVLFVIGAVFFAIVLIIPANPIWALIAGILCGLAGAILWSSSLFVRMGQTIHHRIKSKTVNAESVAKQILNDDDTDDETYELHRTESYDSIDDIIPAIPDPATVTDTENQDPKKS